MIPINLLFLFFFSEYWIFIVSFTQFHKFSASKLWIEVCCICPVIFLLFILFLFHIIHRLEITYFHIFMRCLCFLWKRCNWGAKRLGWVRVTVFVILFCHLYQKGVNSVACYIMIEMRQVVSYFSFLVSINSEGGKRGVYTALWFMQAYCGTCYSGVRYRNPLFLSPVGDLLAESLQGFSFLCTPSLWLQLVSDLSFYWTH